LSTILADLKSLLNLPFDARPNALFGSQSHLARLVDPAADDFDSRHALDAVTSCLTKQAELSCQSQTDAQCLLRAFQALLSVAAQPASDPATHLCVASQALDAYWPASSPVASHKSLLTGSDNVASKFTHWLAHNSCDPRSAAVMGWLLADWGQLNLPERRSASASIISPAGLFRLEVELLPVPPGAKGVFVPDFPAFGLTSIRHTDPLHDTLRSMEQAWKASSLEARWHGRWRIVAPPDQVRNETAGYIQQIYGRSAEAAALCTLLAATGNPYLDREPLSRETTPLDLTVALTAQLAATTHNSPLEIPLEVVGGSLHKLEQAGSHGLQLLLFGPQAAWEQQVTQTGQQWVQEFIDARNKARDDARNKARNDAHSETEDYTGIDVGFVSTVGEALDRLLLTNRLLTRHRDRLRSDWLSRWTGDSGKASVDLRPWPPSDVSSP
jgi:hypothetical protein